MSKQFSYIGQVYRQGDSDAKLVTFCADAKAINEWGGVPQKNDRFDGGFQRALNKRYERIRKFFESGQVSPTAVVVAFRQGVLKIDPLTYPSSAWPSEEVLSSQPQFVKLSFEVEDIDTEEAPLDDLIERAKVLLAARISTDTVTDTEDSEDEATAVSDDALSQDEDGEDTEESEAEDDEDTEVEEVEVDDEEEGDSIDVGHSKLKAFYAFISSKESVEQWIADEQKRYEIVSAKKKKKKRDKEFLAVRPEVRLKQTLVSLLRPAMIVDGQHRVSGAYHASVPEVTFNVCAIAEADWVEQVFQFVVLNKTARPISKGFLSGMLNTSLTNIEIRDVDERLETIGVKSMDRLLLRVVNFDPASPFHDMVAQPGEVAGVDNTGKLKDQGMINLARTWRAMQYPAQKMRLKMFYPALGLSRSNHTQAAKAWIQDKQWMSFFYAFWHSIRNLYEPEGIWVKAEDLHLLKIVTLQVMQDYFLKSQQDAGTQFASVDQFGEKVTAFYKPVKAAFFRGWQRSGLQSGDGPKIIEDALREYRGGETLAKVLQENVLFRKL
jgi:hypothetical protein